MKKQNRTTLTIIISLIVITILITAYITYQVTKSKFESKFNSLQSSLNQQPQEKEDLNCPKEEGKLCDTKQKAITSYKDICEKKKLLSDMSADYIQDLTRCFINGVYCEKVSGFVCHKNSQQKIWYGDSCKKTNLEKIGYMEC